MVRVVLGAGFHLGHDASAALVDRDGLVRFLDKERRSRVKQAIGLAARDIEEVLPDTDDVAVGLSVTQELPIFVDPAIDLSVDGASPTSAATFLAMLPPDHPYRARLGWVDALDAWKGVHAGEGLFAAGGEGARTMRREARLVVRGRAFGAGLYQHHFLHACYAGWAVSADRPALIITADGGLGPSYAGGGIYFWRPRERMEVVSPSDGWAASFYTAVADRLKLGRHGASGGAGKLMGLSSYGSPVYDDRALVGGYGDVSDGYRLDPNELVSRWLARFGVSAEALTAWDPWDPSPPRLVADVAASAQLIFERNTLALAERAVGLARAAGFPFQAVVLSGGAALNCPANSALEAALDVPVLVPPACNDEGLSIGAAVAAFFDAVGAYPAAPRSYAEAAYIGTDVTAASVHGAADRHRFALIADPGLRATARLILDGQLVGLFSGRAEVGPRALGHRSILADPASAAAWPSANSLKRREPWRPFAPAVLWDRAPAYFDGPAESRFMLFTHRATTDALPAVTHRDRSSRLQHVSPQTGLLYRLLIELERTGAPPVLLNTSFNGPGVPIVDTAEDAFAEASRLGLRYILTDWGLFGAT
jgi:carbamoyltransferase